MTTEKAFRRTVSVASCALVLALVVASLHRHADAPSELTGATRTPLRSEIAHDIVFGGVSPRVIIQEEEPELLENPE